MSNDTLPTPLRKKPNVLWWLAGIVLLLVILFFVQLFGPSSRIVVSPQTTYITEPLRPNGLPDYRRYVLEKGRKDVTPENNAATLLWQALWPGELDQRHFGVMIAELGLKEVPSPNRTLLPPYHRTTRAWIGEWLKEQDAAIQAAGGGERAAESGDEIYGGDPYSERAEAVIDAAMSSPWTSAQLPPLAVWIARNREPLQLIIEASRRPRFYSPSPSLLDDSNATLVAMLLPGAQTMRDAARALSLRAMWHLGEGRVDDAWEDLLAMHRLARLLAQEQTMIDQLVAIAICSVACERTVTLLDHGGLSVQNARRIQQEMAALSAVSAMADAIDQMERLSYLDTIVAMSRGRVNEWLEEFSLLTPLGFMAMEWNVLLMEGNRWYDRIATVARMPDWKARSDAFAKLEADVAQLDTDLSRPHQLIGSALSRQKRSQLIANVMVRLFLPGVSAATTAEDRSITTHQLTRLAAALAVYRAEHGEYPESLDALVPAVLPQLPVDLYHGQPFVYQRDGEGYLLYSAGENGIDDGGSNEQMSILAGRSVNDLPEAEPASAAAKIPAGADDMSIRVPRPAVKLPDPPAPNP